jgi:hypothetical protein
MRQTISGWVAGTVACAALAVAMGAAPVAACEVVNPCAQGFGVGFGAGVAYGEQHEGYVRERLPDPQGPQQHYYVNHGPTYTGPGDLAPEPTYDERPIVRPQSYYHRYYHQSYHGGPYANPFTHQYYGAPRVRGPVVYTYEPRRTHFRPYHVAPRYSYTERYGVRHGYAPRFYGPRPMAHGPRMHHVPMYATPRQPMPHNGRPGPVPMPAPNPKPQI